MNARLAAAALGAVVACGAPLYESGPAPPPRPSAEPQVGLTRTLVYQDAGRLDWCHTQNKLAFDRGTRSGVSEVWVIDPDGQNDRCLSCDIPGLPKGLRGNPSWHPSCDWLVIQVSNRLARGGRYEQLAWGIHHDLWAIAADGAWAQRLVETGPQGASLAPHFSRAGDRLLWSVRRATGRKLAQRAGQRTPGAENPWDGWHLALAPVERAGGGRPRLGPRLELFRGEPGGGFYEAHALVGDTLWFSHTPKGAPYVDDVYRARDDGRERVNLTRSPGVWDQYGMPSPAGMLVSFVSSAPFDWRHPPGLAGQLRLELFALGRNGQRFPLSDLNRKLAGEGAARVVPGDHAWGPGGNQIALSYAVFALDGTLAQRIEVVELAGVH